MTSMNIRRMTLIFGTKKLPKLRIEKANASFSEAQKYSWSSCANETFSFLDDVVTEYKKSLCAE